MIPVPDSGTPAAIGYARARGTALRRRPDQEPLRRAAPSSSPNQELREVGLRLKFNPLPHVLDGKRVVVVDDSIVRGTTTRKIVPLLREAGAREVHLRVSSPPIVSPCFYGVDMAAASELIAAGRDIDEVRARSAPTRSPTSRLEGLQIGHRAARLPASAAPA